jgi:putative transposase
VGRSPTVSFLTVVDQWNRQRFLREVAATLSDVTVGTTLDRVLRGSTGPRSNIVEQGTEVPSRALEDWAARRWGQLDFIWPGPPVEHAFIEAFSGLLRGDCFVHHFASIADAQTTIEAWRIAYNRRRPTRSLGHRTPNEFAEQRQATRIVEDVAFSR